MTTSEDAPGGPRRRRRGQVWLGLGGTVVIAAAGVGVWLGAAGTSTGETSATAGTDATATVERGTIAATDSWEGTLDHGAPFTVASSREGTVTWIADQGETVARGEALFRVDERPVALLYGVVPMYRDLGPGDTGIDVEQLETNLAELGYEGFTADDEYTWSTADAVTAWQEDIGTEPTGRVARGAAVFAPEGGQVDALRSDVGEMVTPGVAVLDITGTDKVVSLEVDLEDRDRFEVDAEATVVLPGGDEVAGTVSTMAVGEVGPEGPEDPTGGGDTESVLQVEVAVDEEAPDELVDASVDVVVAVDERTDVLLVPVNALLALAEGGYGLEVVADDGTTSLVPVDSGLFAEGKVEIEAESADIAEGTVVGVAER